MKKFFNILILLSIFLVFLVPEVSFGQCVTSGGDPSGDKRCTEQEARKVPDSECNGAKPEGGLIKCGRKISCQYSVVTKNPDGSFSPDKTKPIVKVIDPKDQCNFNSAIELINNIISFILVYLAIPIATIMLLIGGGMFIFGASNSGTRTKAKGVLLRAVVGLVIAFAAFLIIQWLLNTLGYDSKWIFEQ